MDKILIYWDREGNTLNVWFDTPQKEHICEETGNEVILVKDKQGNTPAEIEERLAMGDFFIDEILTKGKVLYQHDSG